MGYLAINVPDGIKRTLKKMYPPKYEFVGDHVTLKFGVPEPETLPKNLRVRVVGYKHNPEGQEVLVVAVNGKLQRSDGKIYHITWSLDRSKFRPVQSNNLLTKDPEWDDLPSDVFFVENAVYKK